jgi:RND family efflux transporter MFP subunit
VSPRIAALIVISAVACGAAGFTVLQDGRPAAAQPAAAPPPAVTVSAPLQANVADWQAFTGQFAAVDTVEIRARVSGYLTAIHFTDGQVVHKGDKLFTIDPRPYEIALQQANAQYQTAYAQIDLATREYSRASVLHQRDYSSGETVDQRQQQLRAAQAAVEQARAAIDAAKLDLEFSQITAPVTGRIGAHQVSVGSLVSGSTGTGSALLATIVTLDPIHLDFDMSESDYLSFLRAAGRPSGTGPEAIHNVLVDAKLADETDWSRHGVLDFLDNQLDRGSGTIRARATFANADGFLTPGSFGQLRLAAGGTRVALLVPDAAITTDQSRKLVMTVAPDGTVVSKVVQPGAIADGLRVISSGLVPGDQVIINGLLRARPGTKVTPQISQIAAPAQS